MVVNGILFALHKETFNFDTFKGQHAIPLTCHCETVFTGNILSVVENLTHCPQRWYLDFMKEMGDIYGHFQLQSIVLSFDNTHKIPFTAILLGKPQQVKLK